MITIVHIFSKTDRAISFYVTSLFQLADDKIVSIDEYWGEDGEPPTWRKKKKIGKPIVL